MCPTTLRVLKWFGKMALAFADGMLRVMKATNIAPILNVSDMAARLLGLRRGGGRSVGLGNAADVWTVGSGERGTESEKHVPHTARKVRERVRDGKSGGVEGKPMAVGGGVSPLWGFASWAYGSQPLRAGLRCGAPPALGVFSLQLPAGDR
jgi:hypothetical protein